MDSPTPRSSLTQLAYERLRTDVLSGRLRAGEKLKISVLCKALGVSLSAVREALSRLSSESLVIAEPQRGFRVAPVAAEDVRDLTHVRIEIERLCLMRAITAGTVEWESEIIAALHRLNNCPFNPDDVSDEWTHVHAVFHRSLVAACDSRWLLRIREQLFAQGERYRRISVRRPDRRRNLRTEHTEIANAIIGRNLELACNLMEQHLTLTEKLTLGSFEHNNTGQLEGAPKGEIPMGKASAARRRSQSRGVKKEKAKER